MMIEDSDKKMLDFKPKNFNIKEIGHKIPNTNNSLPIILFNVKFFLR